MQQKIRVLVYLALVTLCLGGCAGSSGSAAPHGAAAKGYSNFLVLSVADNYTNRAQFERTVVSNLRAAGASGTPYYEAADGNSPIDREAVRAVLADGGYDAVLVTRVVSTDADVQLQSGSAAAKATRGQIYGDCRLLEELGWVESALVQGPVRLFFCPQCGRVVTEENYSGCEGTMRPFFPRVRRWSLTTTGRGLLVRASGWETGASGSSALRPGRPGSGSRTKPLAARPGA